MRFLCTLSSSSFFLVSVYASTPSIFSGFETVCRANELDFGLNFTTGWEKKPQHNSTQKSNHDRIQDRESFPTTSWTREPECFNDSETGDIYCVYINSAFANGRGISLFTSPSIAKRVEKMAAFVRQGIHDKVNNFTDPPWEIRNIPGRGNGLFATRKLNRGDEVLSSTPVGIYQSDAFYPDYQVGYKYLRKTFDYLPSETRKIFMRMATHSPGDLIMERVNTNAFAGDFGGANHFILCPETALMNHDCRPNAMYHHDQSTLIHAVYASRTIFPGEEITVTYINMLQSRSERQAMLQGPWGFQCTCSLCSKNDSEIHESDSRIQRINELQTILTDWAADSTATPQMAEELLRLYRQEHVHAAEGMGHMFAALEFNGAGDISRAKKHARLAVKAGIVNDKSKEANEEDMLSLRAAPKEHWSYMARRRFRSHK